MAQRHTFRVTDSDAFVAAYERHAEGVYRSAYSVLSDRTQAEDVTQEVFLGLWRRPDRFDPDRADIGTYLRVVARSRALDSLRASGAGRRAVERLEHRVAAEPQAGEEPVARIAAAAQASELRAAVAGLPAAQRETVALSFWGDLSTSEIARARGLPHGTVKSRMRLGLRRLRGSLDEDAHERLAAA